jgi:hypothetical protein
MRPLRTHTASEIHKVGETGFEPATPASRTQCSTGLSYSPIYRATRVAPVRTGRDSNPRGLLTPHDFQSCSLSLSDTCPQCPRAPARRCCSRPCPRRGWDSNPREPFGLDGLANRCRNHLATSPNPLPNCPSWARTRTLLIQSQTCCQLHQGAVSPFKARPRLNYRADHQAHARRPEAACPSRAGETRASARDVDPPNKLDTSRRPEAACPSRAGETRASARPTRRTVLDFTRGEESDSSRFPAERETGLEPATLSLGS